MGSKLLRRPAKPLGPLTIEPLRILLGKPAQLEKREHNLNFSSNRKPSVPIWHTCFGSWANIDCLTFVSEND
jgi:hypothetical protein